MSVGQFKSDAAHLLCGVRQGSVLGSLLFALYLLALVELLIILMASSVISLLMTSSYTGCLLLSVMISCLESSKKSLSDNLLELNDVIMETWYGYLNKFYFI